MSRFQVGALLKEDQLGRVERIDRVEVGSDGRERRVPFAVRRVACGGRLPLSGVVARLCAGRERRALEHLARAGGLEGTPRALDAAELARIESAEHGAPDPRDVVVRSWLEGAPLSKAERLPRDFFDRLDELVQALHARGVCHNDLHKEQNVLVARDGRPALLDFQLASVHEERGRAFEVRAREDLRHVEKHRRRYTRFGRGPDGAHEPQQGAGVGLRRSFVARVWRRTGKPLYNVVTRKLLRTRDGEERRPSSGPWPVWTEPVGPRDASRAT
ncbi:MAG: phosphotransferase [Planctomycetota bacterium]